MKTEEGKTMVGIEKKKGPSKNRAGRTKEFVRL